MFSPHSSNFGTIAGVNHYCTPLSLWKARADRGLNPGVTAPAAHETRKVSPTAMHALRGDRAFLQYATGRIERDSIGNQHTERGIALEPARHAELLQQIALPRDPEPHS